MPSAAAADDFRREVPWWRPGRRRSHRRLVEQILRESPAEARIQEDAVSDSRLVRPGHGSAVGANRCRLGRLNGQRSKSRYVNGVGLIALQQDNLVTFQRSTNIVKIGIPQTRELITAVVISMGVAAARRQRQKARGLEDDSISWNLRDEIPAFGRREHRRTDTEPASEIDRARKFRPRAGEPMHHEPRLAGSGFEGVQDRSGRASTVDRDQLAFRLAARGENMLENPLLCWPGGAELW